MQEDFHITHVYDKRLIGAFDRALPFLQARGVLIGKNAEDEFHGWLQQWLNQPLNMWLVQAKLPKVRCVYEIPATDNGLHPRSE